MGRKNVKNNQYYYYSIRDGDRVRSLYVGRDELARLVADRDTQKRMEMRRQRQAERARREADQAEDRAVAEWFARVERLADATLIAAGFRKHHRSEWRRHRDAD